MAQCLFNVGPASTLAQHQTDIGPTSRVWCEAKVIEVLSEVTQRLFIAIRARNLFGKYQ